MDKWERGAEKEGGDRWEIGVRESELNSQQASRHFDLIIPLYSTSIRVFENKFKFDLTNERGLRKHLTEDIVKDLQSSASIVTGELY